MVRLQTQEDYKRAYFDGPWKIADHYLIVQRWRPLFSWSAALATKIAVWICIPKLPLELCNEIFLSRIGNTIGTMMKVDQVTALHSRGKFARICVEIDLEKQLPSHIVIRGNHVCLEYEGLHAICFRCGKYGHKKEHCKEFMGTNPSADSTGSDNTVPVPENTAPAPSNACSALVVAGKNTPAQEHDAGNIQQAVEEQDLGFGPWNIPKKFQKKKTQKPRVVEPPITKPVVEGGFKYSSSQQDKPEQHVTRKRPNTEVVAEMKQSAHAPVRVRNPAAGKNKQTVSKGIHQFLSSFILLIYESLKLGFGAKKAMVKFSPDLKKHLQRQS